MDTAIRIVSLLAGIPFEALLLSAMLRASWRRFPIAFAYVVFLFVATVVELGLSLASVAGDREAFSLYVRAYWINEWILWALVFAVVISLVYKATASLRSRRVVRAVVVGGAALFAAVTFGFHYAPGLPLGKWMTPWTSTLNFCAAILDVALWTLLIAPREKDRGLLMLSGGLGVLFAGQAIGDRIRTMAQPGEWLTLSVCGGIVDISANLVFLYVWRQAFRSMAENGAVGKGIGVEKQKEPAV